MFPNLSKLQHIAHFLSGFLGGLCAIIPDTPDFEFQILEGVTRSAPPRAYPPPGSPRDLCAKCVLHAMIHAIFALFRGHMTALYNRVNIIHSPNE